MNKTSLTIIVLMIFNGYLFAQLKIFSGGTMHGGSADIVVYGNWENLGTFTASTSTVTFSAASGTQTITKSGGETFNNLTVNKAAGDIQLANNVDAGGTVTLISGDIDLNGNTLDLGSGGTLSESAGNTVKGTSGTITATGRVLNAPSSENVAGMGAVITSGVNMGSTSITRGHAEQTGNSNTGILRYYDISPATNTGLNATLVFRYDESELNSIAEAKLVLFKSIDSGTNWTQEGGSVNEGNNEVTLSSIDGFSRWTLGDQDSPLPVELVSFSSYLLGSSVILNWTTATEVNNYGFEVERKVSSERESDEWELIGFVEGNGNSFSPESYEFIDLTPPAAILTYRLKQIDYDGSYEYLYTGSEVDANILTSLHDEFVPAEYSLSQNYPNPFNPSTTIGYSVKERSDVTFEVYTLLGERLMEIRKQGISPGRYTFNFSSDSFRGVLSSGVLVYRTIMKSTVSGEVFVDSKSMLLIK